MDWLRSIWVRLIALWRQPRQPRESGNPEDFGEIFHLQPITVPAKGDVFYFHVYPTVTLTSDGVARVHLNEMLSTQQQRIRDRIKERVAEVSRNYEPHSAFELERYLRTQFAEVQPSRDGVLVRWHAKVRVLPEKRVQEKLRPYWERRIEMDSEQALSLYRAELIDDLTRRWSQVLENLHRQPFSVLGAKLAEQEFAKIMEELKSEERNTLAELQNLLKDAGRGHRDLGLYEYAETYDKLIKEYQKRYDLLGLNGPESEDSTLGNGRSG